jgi:hypothetical protein
MKKHLLLISTGAVIVAGVIAATPALAGAWFIHH